MAGVLSGKAAIVTGGSANLGKRFATALAQDGADVMVHYNSDAKQDQAEQVAGELRGLGVRAAIRQGDLTRVEEVTGLVDATLEEFGMSINGDIGDPDDVVPVVRFLASPEARWVTAQTVYVNGGLVSPAS
ncbi:SDR family oxidoreductase [Streptomyces roseoverticillatus]|uniref:SDR family oxidoreductase n=1 Tax=Streptomyces roseoverticillatus TaxID=66429 RepID=UPI0004BFD002|nr:SDR family oxidoreductase [Streptomyces roseoverticillatus]